MPRLRLKVELEHELGESARHDYLRRQLSRSEAGLLTRDRVGVVHVEDVKHRPQPRAASEGKDLRHAGGRPC